MHITFVIMLAVAATCATPHSIAKPMVLSDGRITCELADTLRAVSGEDLKTFRAPPLAAFVTPRSDAILTITLAKYSKQLSATDLPQVKTAMETGLESMFPGATWLARELVTINDRRWIHLDLTAQASGRSTRRELYVTVLSGDQLQFLFQSSPVRSSETDFAFSDCIRTLRVSE